MANYCFPSPRLTGVYWSTVAVTAAVIGVPYLLPQPEPHLEPLTIDVVDPPLVLPELQCLTKLDSVLPAAWNCGGTSVEALTIDAVDDPELALRRIVRAAHTSGMPTGPIDNVGDALLLADASTRALSIPTSDGMLLQAVVTGDDAEAIAERILEEAQ